MSDKKVEEKDKVKSVKEATIFSDGGAKPNPGIGGWGIHGNIGGTVYDSWGSIILKAEGSDEHIATNNVAELVAATEGVKLAAAKNVEVVTIKTDSKYVLDSFTKYVPGWIKRGWVKRDGEPVRNKSYWQELISTVNDYEGKVKWEWVKGHSGNKGNEFADRGASMGIIGGQKGEHTRFLLESPVNKHNTFKTPPYHKLLSAPRWYFASHPDASILTEDGKYVYHCGSHGKLDELIGKKISDTIHSVVILDEPEPVLESIRTYQNILVANKETSIFIGRLDNIFNGRVFNDVKDNAFLHLKPRPKSRGELGGTGNTRDIENVDELPLTIECKPPRLVFNLIDTLALLEIQLNEFRHDNLGDGYVVTDVTELLYDTPIKVNAKTTFNKAISVSTV